MSILRKLIFTWAAVLLFFALAEGSLRFFYHPISPWFDAPHSKSIMQPDPELGYRLRPNFTGEAYGSRVSTNRLGFRGREFDEHHKRGKRIVALGDSVTFGFGASDNEHTYPAQLESLLNSSPTTPGAEVINAGIVGYNSLQALVLFREILRYKPDVVLVFIGWNDMGNSLSPNWNPDMKQHVETHSWIPRRAFILLALSDLLHRLRPTQPLYFKAEAITVFADRLHQIIDTARSNGIELFVLTWPTRVVYEIEGLRASEVVSGTGVSYSAWFEYYLKYQDALNKLIRMENLRVIRLAESFSKLSDPRLYYDQIHLSDEGNLRAAQVIYEVLRGQFPARGDSRH